VSDSLAAKIKSAGYYSVSIAPAVFNAKRVPDVAELARIVERSSVRLRGAWSFPLRNQRPIIPDRPDSISEEVREGIHLETWRFFQSGLFVDLRAIESDWYGLHPGGAPRAVAHVKSGELLFMEHAIYAFTETFEFAARLASTEAGDDNMTIEIAVGGLKDRYLAVADPRRQGHSGHSSPARIQEYPQSVRVSKVDLLAATQSLTVTALQNLFKMFGDDIPEHVLRDWLRELRRG
jgi:hypothetical protein